MLSVLCWFCDVGRKKRALYAYKQVYNVMWNMNDIIS